MVDGAATGAWAGLRRMRKSEASVESGDSAESSSLIANRALDAGEATSA